MTTYTERLFLVRARFVEEQKPGSPNLCVSRSRLADERQRRKLAYGNEDVVGLLQKGKPEE